MCVGELKKKQHLRVIIRVIIRVVIVTLRIVRRRSILTLLRRRSIVALALPLAAGALVRQVDLMQTAAEGATRESKENRAGHEW